MNRDIKERIKAAGLHQYEVAHLLGIHEKTFICWLRYELTPERREKILAAIEKGENLHE